MRSWSIGTAGPWRTRCRRLGWRERRDARGAALDLVEHSEAGDTAVGVFTTLAQARETNQQIADALVISRNTVQRHVSNILAKTGAANRTEAGAWAREHGLA